MDPRSSRYLELIRQGQTEAQATSAAGADYQALEGWRGNEIFAASEKGLIFASGNTAVQRWDTFIALLRITRDRISAARQCGYTWSEIKALVGSDESCRSQFDDVWEEIELETTDALVREKGTAAAIKLMSASGLEGLVPKTRSGQREINVEKWISSRIGQAGASDAPN